MLRVVLYINHYMVEKRSKHQNLDFGVVAMRCARLWSRVSMTANTFLKSNQLKLTNDSFITLIGKTFNFLGILSQIRTKYSVHRYMHLFHITCQYGGPYHDMVNITNLKFNVIMFLMHFYMELEERNIKYHKYKNVVV